MASNRLPRINEDIHRTLSELLSGIKDPRVGKGILSVTAVDTSGDLSYCKVYISALGHDSDAELKRGLASASGYLRRELGKALHIRRVPELIFTLDDSIEHGAKINSILKTLQ